MSIYLDHAATTPVRREVLEAMWPYLTAEYGNPSSHHDAGEVAARALDWAREQIAGILGCRGAEVIFTGGGTEANNLAIKGISLAMPRGRHLVHSAIEHPSVTESADHLARLHGFQIRPIGVDSDGEVDATALAAELRADTTLVTVMLANNEVGTIQPVTAIAEHTRSVGAPLHCDAVQAVGQLDITVDTLGVDSLTIAGHKIGAPKGVGALYCRLGVPLEPVIHGGGQERGRRSGTENVAGAVGLATALILAENERRAGTAHIEEMRDRFIHQVLHRVPGARLTGHRHQRLPTNASFTFDGTGGEAVLLELQQRGVLVSSGSACAAGSSEPSTVLTAMGIDPDLALTAVRFTFGPDTTPDDLDTTVHSLVDAVATIRGIVG